MKIQKQSWQVCWLCDEPEAGHAERGCFQYLPGHVHPDARPGRVPVIPRNWLLLGAIAVLVTAGIIFAISMAGLLPQ